MADDRALSPLQVRKVQGRIDTDDGVSAVVLRDVTKRFGPTIALDRVDLTVSAGGIVALLGPNGAGKTTTVDLIAGLSRPDTGTVRLWGGHPEDWARRTQLGVTPQATDFPPSLTVAEILALIAQHYPSRHRAADLADRFGLTALMDRQTGGLSGGQRRLVAVAAAFVGEPALITLDEPTTALDTAARHRVWDGVRAHAGAGGTILLTTHDLAEAEALADRIVVLVRGRIVADGSVPTIAARAGRRRLRVRADRLPSGLPPDAVVLPGDAEAPWTVLCRDTDAVVRGLLAESIAFWDLEIRPATLEEAVTGIVAEVQAPDATDRSR